MSEKVVVKKHVFVENPGVFSEPSSECNHVQVIQIHFGNFGAQAFNIRFLLELQNTLNAQKIKQGNM